MVARWFGFAALMLAAAGCAAGPRHEPYVVLGESLEPVRERFNAERAHARLLALFSPT